MKNEGKIRSQIIEAVTTPIGFFVLALLIVESFLAAVLIGASLDETIQMYCIFVGVGLFVFVTIVVAILVWFKPDNLTYDKEAHLRDRGKPPFGTQLQAYSSGSEMPPPIQKGQNS